MFLLLLLIMKIETYEFLFHPFSDSHDTGTKALSVVATIALTAITGGLYLIVFAGVRAWEACAAPPDTKEVRKTKRVAEQKTILVRGENRSPKATQNRSRTELSVQDFGKKASHKGGSRRTQKVSEPKPSGSAYDEEKVARIKKKQAIHYAKLKHLADRGGWQHLATHTSHSDSGFDWWMFPVSRKSSYGHKWSVFAKEIAALKSDDEFMDSYRAGVVLVAKSWGWDVVSGTNISRRKWSGYQVRLGKMLTSLRLFGQDDLRRNLVSLVQKDCRVDQFEDWIQIELVS